MARPSLLLALSIVSLSAAAATAVGAGADNARWVDPFIGTGGTGHTFPGAAMPMGMVQTSPVTGGVGWEYCAEYVYPDTVLWGFTQDHLNGTGCMDLGDVLVMPFTGQRIRPWDGYRTPMDKASEKAWPGYYSVELPQAGVLAEATATPRTALHRYTFHGRPDSIGVLVDLQHGPAWNQDQYHSQVLECQVVPVGEDMLVGRVRNRVWVDQTYYFALQFSRPWERLDTLAPARDTERGQRLVATFRPGGEEGQEPEVLMKVALSTVSPGGALANLQAEQPGWDFDATAAAARQGWNAYLDRVDIQGDDRQKTNAYTALYHTLLQPNNLADADGLYRDSRGSVTQARDGQFYSTFSTWDTYRAAHPFYTIFIPDKVGAFVNSLTETADARGVLPVWGLWGKDTYTMVANHAVPIIAEAYAKGITEGYDPEAALDAMRRTQTVSHPQKSDWETYLAHGYFPTDRVEAESVSSTLETAYDDYAVADMARRLGHQALADTFSRRADYYRNLWDPSTGFMRPRRADGTWLEPFDPTGVSHAESVGGDYTEGNAWQYTWHVQHDVPGLVGLMGGPEKFRARLDSLFTLELATTQADVTGLIGSYAHGNEPSHHVAYLYAMAGDPGRTQELVRQITDTQYNPGPYGLCGNDDCGQMSAWYLLSAMGFYPVDPVSATYVLGAPQLPEASIDLGGGKTFRMVAHDLSEANRYVARATMDGRDVTGGTISHRDIAGGGTLEFWMTDQRPEPQK